MSKAHGLQYNTGPGGLMYSPSRDFAYNYPQLVKCIINSFNVGRWPELVYTMSQAHYADRTLTEEEDAFIWGKICEAKDVYCNFLNECCVDPDETVDQVLDRVGWNNLPEAAQITWLAMMGQVMTGQVFQGLRDVTYQGEGARSEVKELLQAGQAARRAMNGIDAETEREVLELALKEAAEELAANGLSKSEILDIVRKTL